MKNLKLLALVAAMAAALVVLTASAASATTLNLPAEYPISSEAEGTTILESSIGEIECSESKVSGKTTNEGSSTETVSGNIESLTFAGCNATVTVLANGSLEIHTNETNANNNGTLTSTGTEVTVEAAGFHCIFKTSGTDLGTLTGSANTKGNATLDIEATVPRTGGKSGAFCGTTANWSGSYKVAKPNPLNVDGTSGEVSSPSLTMKVGETKNLSWSNNTEAKIKITLEFVSDVTLLETLGSACGEIPLTTTCNTRKVKCLKKGQGFLSLQGNNDFVGMTAIKCD